METFGEVFDAQRGDPKTIIYSFKTTPLGSGRYLMAFTARKDLAILRQHTKTDSGLKEVAVGFNKEQLEELQRLIPQLLKEMDVGRTSDEDSELASAKWDNEIKSMPEGGAKSAILRITEILRSGKTGGE